MKYALAEVQLANPTALSIAADEDGIGILVRDGDIPVAFILKAAPPGTIDAAAVERLLSAEAGLEIVHARLRKTSTASESTLPARFVTVAICTRDHPDNVARAIASLQTAAYANTDAMEILIVDNAPSDERTRQVVEGFPGVRYVREPKPGLDFARNRALQEATGELIAYIDDDAVVDRYWMTALGAAAREHPDATAFTGPIVPYELQTTAQILFEHRGGFGRRFFWRRYGAELSDTRTYPCNSGLFGAGCNMTFRRSALVALGGFDDALDTGSPLPGGGDLDILFRIVSSGGPLIHESRLLVYHQHRRDYAALKHQMYTWGLGSMAYAMKHYRQTPVHMLRFRCMVLGFFRSRFGMMLRSLQPDDPWKLDLALAELWGGIVGICGEYGRSQRRIARIRQRFP